VMTQLTKTNADLTQQLAEQMTTMLKLQQQLAQANANNGGGGGGGGGRGGGGRGDGGRGRGGGGRGTSTKKWYNNMNYCWSHGYDVAESHTGATCMYPKTGHKVNATREVNLDGSQANKNKVP
jgi:hypothetical protein